MADTVTLLQLRTRARRRADIESFTTRFPDAELDDEINESLARLYSILIAARGVGYYEKSYSFSTRQPGPVASVSAMSGNGVTPIAVTTSAAHGFNTGDQVSIQGALGNTNANTTATIIVTAPTTFTMTGLTGNGTWSGTTTAQVTAELYALPSDFVALTSIETVVNGSNVYLRSYHNNERPWLKNISDWSLANMAPMYMLRGNNISFAPIPNAVYPVTMYYIPAPPSFATDGSGDTGTFDGICGYEEWIVLDVARKCLMKDDRDASAIIAERTKIEDELAKEIPYRDAANSERVCDRGYVDFSVAGSWWGVR